MGKIVYLMGKSSSGKDTIYKKLLEQDNLAILNKIGEIRGLLLDIFT